MRTAVVTLILVLVAGAAGYWVQHRDTHEPAAPQAAQRDTVKPPGTAAVTPRAPNRALQPAAGETPNAEAEREFKPIQVYADTDYMDLASQMGIDAEQFRLEIMNWFDTRGFPPGYWHDFIDLELDQPYEQYDFETLEALADGGDARALVMVAESIREERPAEAAELLRKSAVEGSVYAMERMGELYRHIADDPATLSENPSEEDLQRYAMRSSVDDPNHAASVWFVAAEIAGRQTAGPASLGFGANDFSSQETREICEEAVALVDGMNAERKSLGRPAYEAAPNPLMLAEPAAKLIRGSSTCPPDVIAPADVSRCNAFSFEEGSLPIGIYYCGSADRL